MKDVARRGTRADIVLPARARNVAADDAFDRQHLEPPALARAPVGAQPVTFAVHGRSAGVALDEEASSSQ